ncbi:unnamed protein product [Ectocarpus sp. CCAP 1310/34]|nr:unnamed protein product [Ectocarpus sp. CCAP 1310/34]
MVSSAIVLITHVSCLFALIRARFTQLCSASQVVVFSEGTLYLDECNFSGSTASVLVYSEGDLNTVVRNAVLGDNNSDESLTVGTLANVNERHLRQQPMKRLMKPLFLKSLFTESSDFDVAKAASTANEIPTAHSLMNVNVTCDGWMRFSSTPPCSEGSPCIDGDLGVYCQCYTRESSIAEGSPSETCVTGDPGLLDLTVLSTPADAVFPTMLAGELLLTLNGDETATTTSSAGGSGVAVSGGRERKAAELPYVPYRPHDSTTLHVVTLPREDFNGEATVSFQADGMSPPASPVAEAAAAVVV